MHKMYTSKTFYISFYKNHILAKTVILITCTLNNVKNSCTVCKLPNRDFRMGNESEHCRNKWTVAKYFFGFIYSLFSHRTELKYIEH